MGGLSELVGYLASGLVLTTFTMTDMRSLRAVAIASNLAFLAYAGPNRLMPVLCLHAILLPLNIYRLLQIARCRHSVRPRRGQARDGAVGFACRGRSSRAERPPASDISLTSAISGPTAWLR